MFVKYVEGWDESHYKNSVISYDKSREKHTGKQASILESTSAIWALNCLP